MKIDVKNVYKAFDEKEVLSDISMSFESGNIYRLKGDSGKGKTTLLRIMSGLLLPDRGSVIYTEDSGNEIKIDKDCTLRGLPGRLPDISYMFQEDRLFLDRTPLVNIKACCPDTPEHEIEEKLLKVLPKDAISKKVEELSGGMKRKVSLIRALMHKSGAVFLDEPFTGMDEESIKACRDLIHEMAADRIMIIVSHIAEDEGNLVFYVK